jgi:hypothetical protein
MHCICMSSDNEFVVLKKSDVSIENDLRTN